MLIGQYYIRELKTPSRSYSIAYFLSIVSSGQVLKNPRTSVDWDISAGKSISFCKIENK